MKTPAPLSTLPGEEGIVCPTCLLANPPSAAFCSDCGAPIGMYTTVDPIHKIYAEGFAFRSAVDGPPRRIVLIGVWLLFLPPVLYIPLAAVFNTAPVGSLYSLIGGFMLYRVTKNYIVKTRAAREQQTAEN